MEIVQKLRMRVADYRRENQHLNEVSVHISAIDIVISLTELGIRESRPISIHEMNWFRAGLYLDYILSGSEWEDIVEDFSQIVNFVKSKQYFKSTD